MIKIIDFQNIHTLTKLFELQRASYYVEAELIGFFDLPPLKETFEEFQHCGEIFLGYFEEDELAGALSFKIEREELTICRMVVHPNHFRKGIAQMLLNNLEENNQESTILKVSTGKENSPAKSLYLKNGYQFVRDLMVAPGVYISQFEKFT
ncbi:GNAT family N-acetyltransferase [Lysinibacillus xylanilyticus]|uniref:GNAT family N-acetyltransferase n=1 Tax=Lysinibacillus xylanilyticus TaxID=582475 RepID=UPI003D006D0D